jgi:hypothetical protein
MTSLQREEKKMKKEQLIWNGSDSYVIADERNSEAPSWPVDDNGRWVYPAFPEQRVLFHKSSVFFGFLAEEISMNEVPLDEDGEPVFNNGFYMTEDHRVFRAI